jgi:oligoribonuclease
MPLSLSNSLSPEWCQKTHNASGLTKKVQESRVSAAMASKQILSFLKEHIPPKVAPLAGSSVHVDRQFLIQDFDAELIDYLHYRIVDVSSIKEVCRRFNPSLFEKVPRKKGSHRALDDILESIEELKWYRQNFFKSD